jgi:Mn2+/Fe2+ NRAMP family transporter
MRLWRSLGPGLISGASDDDPSGIGTYSQAGEQLGYAIGWTMLLTYPLMVGIQEISARLGRTIHQSSFMKRCPGALINGARTGPKG